MLVEECCTTQANKLNNFFLPELIFSKNMLINKFTHFMNILSYSVSSAILACLYNSNLRFVK